MSDHGGSRAAKKRRMKENNTANDKIKSNEKESIPLMSEKKKIKHSADSLSHTAIELLESASVPSSSSSLCKKDLMKLSVKEVLALEEIIEIDCSTRASIVLSIILAPYERKTFYSDYWEKRPLHCANDGDKKKAVKGLLSSKQFRNILKSQSLLFAQDITTSRMRADQMSGKDDDNEELIEAKEKELWEQVEEGCSLRLLSPQKFHDPLWSLLSCLEFEFGHKVSCYVDFIPPGISFFSKYDISLYCLRS
jgi:lysine-specific demethylase/histidyl-hydroxylase NO66